jgi:hypothetical protein
MEKQMDKHTLSDKAIARIVDLLQVALLTGTDIVDNLRTLRLTLEDGKLTVDQEEDEIFRQGIARLQEQAQQLSSDEASLQ